MKTHKTTSLKQTQKFAGSLAKKLYAKALTNSEAEQVRYGAGRHTRMRKNALIFALTGDLGTGKTSFTQGFLRALGIKRKITSPSFVLMKNYKLLTTNHRPQTINYKNIYHLDCYRIKKAGELKTLGLKEIFNNPENIVLVEWAERIRRAIPQNAIWLKFEHGEKENERKIKTPIN